MIRFEITNSVASGIAADKIARELRAAGALRVSKRRAFGWRNQPHVATFAAVDDRAARALCETAGRALYLKGATDYIDSLIPYAYGES